MPCHASSFTTPSMSTEAAPLLPRNLRLGPGSSLGLMHTGGVPGTQRRVGVGSQADAAQHKAGAPDPQGLTLSLPGQEKVQI